MVFLTKLCECGCGNPAPIANKTRKRWGHIKGMPIRFIRGHARTKKEFGSINFEIDKETGCWNWLKCVNNGGYGVTSFRGKRKYAHRLMYELTYGPIPESLDLDHLCRNRMCVNPKHLEAVTRSVNVLRGDAVKTMKRCSICNMLTSITVTICKRCEKRIVEVEDNSIPSEGLISA